MNNNAVHFAYLGGGGGGHFGYAYPNDDMQLNSMVTAGSSSCLCYDDRAGEFVGYYVQKHYPIKSELHWFSAFLKPVGESVLHECDLIYMGATLFVDFGRRNVCYCEGSYDWCGLFVADKCRCHAKLLCRV